MATDGQKLTRDLLARAHSPSSVDRIYSEKIQYRTLHLRPTSPPPKVTNAREARRKARQQTKERKKSKPKPLSSRERRSLGLYDIPQTGHKYETYEGLEKLWQGYIREVLGSEIHTGGQSAAAKLASAEFHGARLEVVRSRCPGRVGIKGIVVRDRRFVFEMITPKRGLKMVPKEGTTFRVCVSVQGGAADGPGTSQENTFIFDVLGDQMMLRSADRANRKFKSHFLKDL